MSLVVRNLCTSFPVSGKAVNVVDEVGFELEPGRCVALVGESGSGKSMTALSLLGLVPSPGRISAGSVELDGDDLLRLSREELRRRRGTELSMIFQEPMTALSPVARVGEQVSEVLLVHGKASRESAKERTIAMFRKVGIPDPESRYDAYPHQLSGGLKQRIVIAMALVSEPRVVIADEPTTALDVTIQAQILQLLRELLGTGSTSAVLITHDFGVVNQLADDVLVMYAGRIVERGSVREVLRSPMHPYTVGLLRALPSEATRGGRLYEIPGSVPSPADWPKGCRFSGRCPEVMPRCSEAIPELVQLRSGVEVACFARGRDA